MNINLKGCEWEKSKCVSNCTFFLSFRKFLQSLLVFFENKVYKRHEIEAFGIGLMLIMQQHPSHALYVQERDQWDNCCFRRKLEKIGHTLTCT